MGGSISFGWVILFRKLHQNTGGILRHRKETGDGWRVPEERTKCYFLLHQRGFVHEKESAVAEPMLGRNQPSRKAES